jgi:hypothetical protein
MKWSSIRPVCVFGPGWDQDTVSRIWKTTDVEILIVNLSRRDLRRKFFKPAIPADERGTIVSIGCACGSTKFQLRCHHTVPFSSVKGGLHIDS